MALPMKLVLSRFGRRLREQGGSELSEPCRPTELAPAGDWKTIVHTTGCGGTTRFGAPYEGEEGEHRIVTACITDDLAYLWPRFQS